ncbi:hypothetical protein PAXRUDRAFT_519733 [Paxillus rubicundulus Ve08.2h10]|uniref:Uncharacterized protein n=1 Tax=Paxillus rubicundulus Ve08.2h10 TaxID=930991 RepID=A0A0D0DV97_9AGAM|nr:hypothetical protein PAXRUDRAFT_519733 [Paxillus rubicundulus Ve08.2h10]
MIGRAHRCVSPISPSPALRPSRGTGVHRGGRCQRAAIRVEAHTPASRPIDVPLARVSFPRRSTSSHSVPSPHPDCTHMTSDKASQHPRHA